MKNFTQNIKIKIQAFCMLATLCFGTVFSNYQELTNAISSGNFSSVQTIFKKQNSLIMSFNNVKS